MDSAALASHDIYPSLAAWRELPARAGSLKRASRLNPGRRLAAYDRSSCSLSQSGGIHQIARWQTRQSPVERVRSMPSRLNLAVVFESPRVRSRGILQGSRESQHPESRQPPFELMRPERYPRRQRATSQSRRHGYNPVRAHAIMPPRLAEFPGQGLSTHSSGRSFPRTVFQVGRRER